MWIQWKSRPYWPFAALQSGLEKNLFGNHPVTLPGTEPREPPPAFASDPLKQVSVGGKDSEGLAAIATGSSKPASLDIVEMDGSTSAPSSMSNHETNFMKSTSPSGVSTFFSMLQEVYYVLQILILCVVWVYLHLIHDDTPCSLEPPHERTQCK